jgi:hypothetical protein
MSGLSFTRLHRSTCYGHYICLLHSIHYPLLLLLHISPSLPYQYCGLFWNSCTVHVAFLHSPLDAKEETCQFVEAARAREQVLTGMSVACRLMTASATHDTQRETQKLSLDRDQVGERLLLSSDQRAKGV